VPGDQRGGHVVLAVHATEVTSADAGRPDLDADLPRFEVRCVLEGVGQPDVFLAVVLLDKALHGDVLRSTEIRQNPSSRPDVDRANAWNGVDDHSEDQKPTSRSAASPGRSIIHQWPAPSSGA